MANNRRAQVLAATLVVAMIGMIVVRSMGDSSPAQPSTQPVARAGRTPTPAAGELVAPHVNLAALARDRGEPTPQGRDPFRFRPPPVAAPADNASELADTFEGAANPAMPLAPPGPPSPPPITLKFIGLVEKADGTKIAVLSDGRGPIHGVEGQEIEGRYKILKIGIESIEIAYIDGRGRQTIRLTGQ